jgi:hypothetical protein
MSPARVLLGSRPRLPPASLVLRGQVNKGESGVMFQLLATPAHRLDRRMHPEVSTVPSSQLA